MSMKDKAKGKEIAEQRMSMIAPLLSVSPGESAARKKEEISNQFQVSVRTLERYLAAYEKDGFEALIPKGRDGGGFRIPEHIVDEAILLRREQPSRSVPSIIRILELEGKVKPGELKRTTLQDAMSRRGYSASMMKIYQDTSYDSQRFQRQHRFDLWQGDIKYGPMLMVNGEKKPTYFCCLIDDATRYIVHGEFYDNMEQSIVEDTLHKAITKYGAPRRLYFDNGRQYRTHWMRRVCDLLGIRLIYAKPRNPKGKGKQERFNRTLDAFLDEINLNRPDTLEEMNRRFDAWLSECYHSQNHSGLGTTPEIAFKSDSMPQRFIDTALMATAFLHCEPRKADKSGCISFNGKKYDLGAAFAGRQVDVVYSPQNTETLTIEVPSVAPFQVRQLVVGERVGPRPKRADVERIPVDHSRLLDAVSASHAEKNRRKSRAISYSTEVNGGDSNV